MTDEEKAEKSKKAKNIGCLILILIFIGLIYVTYTIMSAFTSNNYEENTTALKDLAPSLFTEETKLDYPSNSELKHISIIRWGVTSGNDLLLFLSDIDSFIEDAKKIYTFESLKMNYPEFERGKDFNLINTDFCGNFQNVGRAGSVKDWNIVKDKTPFKNFCGDRQVLITQIFKDVETGIVLVILPNEGLVWLNASYSF